MADCPNSPGASKYPIKEGSVFRLEKTQPRFNKKIGLEVEHTVYIWIQRFNTGKYKGQPKNRPVKVLFLYIPTLFAFKDKYIIWEREVQFKYVAKRFIDYGYELVIENCKYNYSKWAYKNFYKKLGLIKE